MQWRVLHDASKYLYSLHCMFYIYSLICSPWMRIFWELARSRSRWRECISVRKKKENVSLFVCKLRRTSASGTEKGSDLRRIEVFIREVQAYILHPKENITRNAQERINRATSRRNTPSNYTSIKQVRRSKQVVSTYLRCAPCVVQLVIRLLTLDCCLNEENYTSSYK